MHPWLKNTVIISVLLYFLLFFQEPTATPSGKKEVGVPEVGVSEERVCCRPSSC